MPVEHDVPILRRMTRRPSYAVCWREGDGPVHVGKLELHDGQLTLEGQTADRAGSHSLSIVHEEIAGVTIGRSPVERIRGLPSLVVERACGVAVYVTSPVGFGAVQELARALGQESGSRPRPVGRALSVVIVGGGVAALEAMLALRSLAEERVAITLVSAAHASRTGRWSWGSRSTGSRRRVSTWASSRPDAARGSSSTRSSRSTCRPGRSGRHGAESSRTTFSSSRREPGRALPSPGR
jgi:hypothetical protein